MFKKIEAIENIDIPYVRLESTRSRLINYSTIISGNFYGEIVLRIK